MPRAIAVKDEKGNPVTEKAEMKEQVIPLGPAASQIAIKQLGTNGGGFFNVNSAHPLENPTAFSNFLEMLAIILIPAALCITFGKMVGDKRQGWALLSAMTIVLVTLMALMHLERAGRQSALRIHRHRSDSERLCSRAATWKEKKPASGSLNSAIWATATTAASNGSVNSMHDSFTPMGGLYPLALIQLGEVIFGGVGSGLYGMLIMAIITVFIAGLMVGRTPEYLGQEDRNVRDEDGLGRGAGRECAGQDRHGSRRCNNSGSCGSLESRAAWIFRDPLRLFIRSEQQRQRLCGPLRQHGLL